MSLQPIPQFARLLRHLHRGGGYGFWCYESVGRKPHNPERPAERRSIWWPCNDPADLPPIEGRYGLRHVWYGVHPCSEIPKTNRAGEPRDPQWVRSQNDYICAINCLYAEFDAKDFGDKAKALEHIHGLSAEPTVIIDSGGGYHCYWLLDEPWLLDDESRPEARALQHAWVAAVGGDRGAKNLNRVLRVPGSINCKPDYAPDHPRVIFVEDSEQLYKLDDLRALIPVEALERSEEGGGGPAANLDDIALAGQLLQMLSPVRRDSYQEWIEVGMALCSLGTVGLSLWEGWSSGSPKYKKGDCKKRWGGFSESGRGFGSLQMWAKEDRPQEYSRLFSRTRHHNPRGAGLLQAASAATEAPAPCAVAAWSPEDTITVEAGNRTYVFGDVCLLKQEKKVDGEMVPVSIPLAYDLWPLQRYRSEEDGEYGYRFLYLDTAKQRRFAIMPAGASVERNAGKRACVQLANTGVRVATDSQNTLAVALGHWAQRTDPPTVTLVRTSGWHKESVYVNGDRIFGAEGWYVDEESPAIANRTGRGGSLEAWSKGLKLHARTKGLQIAIGQGLAGALIEPLHLHPFALHLWIDSTQGKSTAAYLAASIWGHPDQTFKTWNTTAKSPEALAEQMNGACLVLDEIAQYEYEAPKLAQTIHALCSPIGRSSLSQGRALNAQRRWRCTILSTGEISARIKLDDHYQGGHRVRFLDLRCEPGTLAHSKLHAEEVRAFCYEQYGLAGDAWIGHLLKPESMKRVRAKLAFWQQRAERHVGPGMGPEEGRIGAQLAVIAVALDAAREAELTPWSLEEIDELLAWAIQGALDDERASDAARPSTPNERALELFYDWELTQPYRYPDSRKADNSRDVIAYKVNGNFEDNTYKLYTAEGMIQKSGLPAKANVSPRSWVTWAVKNGLAERTRKITLPGGQRGIWVVFDPGQTAKVANSATLATSENGIGREKMNGSMDLANKANSATF